MLCIKGEYLHPFALFSKASHFARGHPPSPQLSPKSLVMLLLISSFTGKGLRKSHLCLFFVLVDSFDILIYWERPQEESPVSVFCSG